jgi:5-oxoprolinase (ATP-hydrolysing)
LNPDQFPRIFGPKENEALDYDASFKLFIALADIINKDLLSKGQPTKTVEEIAYGFVNVANESMSRPIREITQTKGYHASQHALACFGGAVNLRID